MKKKTTVPAQQPQTLVIFVERGQVRRLMADFEGGINCLVAYSDVPTMDQGQPWVRKTEWPSKGRQTVLIEGLAVEHCPSEVQVIVRTYEESGKQVRALLDDSNSSIPKRSDDLGEP